MEKFVGMCVGVGGNINPHQFSPSPPSREALLGMMCVQYCETLEYILHEHGAANSEQRKPSRSETTLHLEEAQPLLIPGSDGEDILRSLWKAQTRFRFGIVH